MTDCQNCGNSLDEHFYKNKPWAKLCQPCWKQGFTEKHKMTETRVEAGT